MHASQETGAETTIWTGEQPSCIAQIRQFLIINQWPIGIRRRCEWTCVMKSILKLIPGHRGEARVVCAWSWAPPAKIWPPRFWVARDLGERQESLLWRTQRTNWYLLYMYSSYIAFTQRKCEPHTQTPRQVVSPLLRGALQLWLSVPAGCFKGKLVGGCAVACLLTTCIVHLPNLSQHITVVGNITNLVACVY